MEYIVTRDNDSDELYHYGVKGMKWGVRRAMPQTAVESARSNYKTAKKDYNKAYSKAYGYSSRHPIGQFTNKNKKAESDKRWNQAIDAAKKVDSAKTDYKAAKKEAKAENKANKKPMSTAKKVAIGAAATAAIVGGAYGAYKLSKYVQDKRSSGAMQKASDYVNKNLLNKVGESTFANGSRETYFKDKLGTSITISGRGSKAIGDHNANVMAKGRQMYKDATNTRLDRGLSKVVGAGDAIGNTTKKAGKVIGNTTKKAGNAAKRVGTTAKNRVLDVVNPMYEYVPGTSSTTVRNMDGLKVTNFVQNYDRRKIRRR